jgi:hypothetical protein
MKNQGVFKLGILGVLIGIMLSTLAGCGGSGGGSAKEGQLPTLGVGDKWTYEASSEGSYFTLTYTVTGEGDVNGEDCWNMEWSLTPAYMGMNTASTRVSKATLALLQMQASMTVMGFSVSVSSVSSFSPSDASAFPLEVGRQFNRTEKAVQTTISAGGTQTENTTTTHTFKVEAVEDITVQAGTFKCFKITDTSEKGTATDWYSDKVKLWVKTIGEDGSTTELKSYSV